MRKVFTFLLIICLLSSCANQRQPQLVMVKQEKDDLLTCAEIEAKLKGIDISIHQRTTKLHTYSDKDYTLAFLGAFLLVPYFYMDNKDADLKEVVNLVERYNHLVSVSKSKNCPIVREPIPIRKDGLSVDEELEKDSL